MSERLLHALQARIIAEQAVRAVLDEDYGIGCAITWRGASGEIASGTVRSHDRVLERVQVHNVRTGNTHYIGIEKIIP